MVDKKKKSEYDQNFQKSHMKRLTVWFNNEKDADIISLLDASDCKSELVKKCLRDYIQSSRKE